MDHFNIKNWKELLEDEVSLNYPVPKKLEEIDPTEDRRPEFREDMNGWDYIYTEDALGMSYELQDRLEKHVTGKSVSTNGITREWRSLRSLKEDLRINIPGRRFLGDVYFKEFREKFDSHN